MTEVTDPLFIKEETKAQRGAVPFAGITQSGTRDRRPQLHICKVLQYGTFILKDGFASPLELSSHKYMDQMSTAVLIITAKIWKQSRWPT